jgi:hypothetical protein
VHDLNGAAAARPPFAWDAQEFSLRLWGSVTVAKAGEDMIDVGHEVPGVLDLGHATKVIGWLLNSGDSGWFF